MPAWWAVATPSPAAGTPGVTDATFTGALVPNGEYTPDAAGLITVWADTAEAAVGKALRGAISATIADETVDYYFTPDHVGVVADHLPFATSMSGTTVTLALEDQAYFPDIEPDWDYNDWSMTVSVAPTADPVVFVDSWLWDNPSAGSATVQLKVTRPAEDKFHWLYAVTNNDLSKLFASPGLNQFQISSVGIKAADVTMMDTDQAGWSETLQDGMVAWQEPCLTDGPYVAKTKTAKFWFDTPPLPVASATGGVAVAGIDGSGGGGSQGAASAGGDDADCDCGVMTAASMGPVNCVLVDDAAGGKAAAMGEKPRVYITDGNNVDIGAAGLKVAKWQNAFFLNATGKATVDPIEAKTGLDFIDGDTDRFNVWVYDSVKWDAQANLPPAQQRNTVRISTTNVVGFEAYNDDATEVDLIRCVNGFGKGDGWYWSDSQMLVSNKVDDVGLDSVGGVIINDLRFNGVGSDDVGPGAGFGPVKHGMQWKVSDRTHRVALRGTVKAEYEDAVKIKVKDEDPVKRRHTVNVNVSIMSNAAAGNAGVLNIHEANSDFVRANEQFAQAGILLVPRFQQNLAWPLDPATGKALNLADGLDEHPDRLDGNGKIRMTDEEKVLLSNYRTPVTTDIELYYVESLSGDSRGEAFPASLVPDAKYQDSVVVSASARGHFDVAHEIMHVVNDAGHYNGLWFQVNLLRASPDPVDAVTATKRIRSDQDLEMNGDPSETPAVPAKRPNLMN